MFAQTQQDDPFILFDAWHEEAKSQEINDPNAMALATVGPDGMPAQRMVLLKDVSDGGFVFYTNYESRKGTHVLAHPRVALLFHWKSLRRQVRIEGEATQVDPEEADAYFASRAKQSQIGAWASQQSRPLESRHALEKRVAQYAAKYGLGTVPRPPHWSGFRVTPRLIEFWKDGAFRLHDRLVYHQDPSSPTGWRTERLYP
ncbi:pyridoxamine 5'-phosphate oxidase [Algihabitans sp.]|uniref:pyridoxamine 5'-phosphate oxidase n=1 Tax=Algihabitans sp. TaxID=2821514 RepID=UPI003BA92B99